LELQALAEVLHVRLSDLMVCPLKDEEEVLRVGWMMVRWLDGGWMVVGWWLDGGWMESLAGQTSPPKMEVGQIRI
jgi:hypothetical protein